MSNFDFSRKTPGNQLSVNLKVKATLKQGKEEVKFSQPGLLKTPDRNSEAVLNRLPPQSGIVGRYLTQLYCLDKMNTEFYLKKL
jgi:hypothetical protein